MKLFITTTEMKDISATAAVLISAKLAQLVEH